MDIGKKLFTENNDWGNVILNECEHFSHENERRPREDTELKYGILLNPDRLIRR